MKSNQRDLVIGFVLLLVFIIAIGAVGGRQVWRLAAQVDLLVSEHIPLQNAVTEMKNALSLYAGGVRNYVTWRFGRYLDAGRFAVTEKELDQLVKRFEENRRAFPAEPGFEQTWRDIRDQGERIVTLVNRSVRTGREDYHRDRLDRMLARFQSDVYGLSALIENSLEVRLSDDIRGQLSAAQLSRDSSMKILPAAVLAALLLGIAIARRVYVEQRDHEDHREQLVDRMVRAEERERQNLSFQVHNQMGQELSALKIYTGLIRQKAGDIPEIEEIRSITARLIEQMHDISALLSPPGLDDIGLIPTLDDLIEHYRRVSPAEITFDRPDEEFAIKGDYALTIYRIVQEALTNIVKHATADRINVSLRYQGAMVVLTVEDNGTGFDTQAHFSKAGRAVDGQPPKLGLVGLRERVQLMRGRMNISSGKDRGTVVSVTLPVA